MPTPSDAYTETPRRQLSKATIDAVCASLAWEIIVAEIGHKGRVILRVVRYDTHNIHYTGKK